MAAATGGRETLNRLIVILVAGMVTLAGCAAPTPYEPGAARQGMRIFKGYSDEQLAPDRYRVAFAGNWVTPRAVVEDYMLYRAAEITVQSGHDYFRVLERRTEHRVIRKAMADFGPGLGFGLTGGLSAVYPGHTFEAVATIEVAEGAPPAGDPKSFDARGILRALAPAKRHRGAPKLRRRSRPHPRAT